MTWKKGDLVAFANGLTVCLTERKIHGWLGTVIFSTHPRYTAGDDRYYIEDAQINEGTSWNLDSIKVIGGEVWWGVHSPARCQGRHCALHRPSNHRMRGWNMHLRETGLIERMCSHGVGHPDPDSASYLDKIHKQKAGTWSVHGCDGCCGS